MGRQRLTRVPRVGMRLLVAVALRFPPPGDYLGGWGRGDKASFIYYCYECDSELPPENEQALPGEEPICPIDRKHGRTRFLRQD